MIDGVGFVCNRPCACVLCPWCCAGTAHCPGAKWTQIKFPRARQARPCAIVDPILSPPATMAAMAAFPGTMHIQIQAAIRGNARLQHRAAEFGVDPKAYATVINEQPTDAAAYLALLHIAPRVHTVLLEPTLLDVYCAGLFRRRRVRNERVTCGMSMLNAETGQSGVSIGHVRPESSAHKCGIIAGCVLTAVNGVDVRGYTSNATSRLIFREIEKPSGCWDEWSVRAHCARNSFTLPPQLPRATPTPATPAPTSGTVWFRRAAVALTYFVATVPNRMARIEPRTERWSAISMLRRAWELVDSLGISEAAVAVVYDARNAELADALHLELKSRARGRACRARGRVSDRVTVEFYVEDDDGELARLVKIAPALVPIDGEDLKIAAMEALRNANYVVIDSFADAQTANSIFSAVHCLQNETD